MSGPGRNPGPLCRHDRLPGRRRHRRHRHHCYAPYYGEYPTCSGRYWGFPTEGDADGWAYRKDLFENPDEMAAFQAQYGYPLAVPETYDQLLDIAKFFTRPDQGLYGVAIYTQKDYDAITMGVENTFFTYGADWKNPATNEVQGIVHSDKAIEALEMVPRALRVLPGPRPLLTAPSR